MEAQKIKILELGCILTGTITKRYVPCGKLGCRCVQDRENWHGPYYVWTRKEKNKTITKSLSHKQAKYCRKAFANMKILKLIIEKWKEKSAKALKNIK